MAKRPIRMVALLGTMLGLAACAAPDQWQHPQTGTAMVQQDLSDCYSTARRQSWRTPGGDSFATTRQSGLEYGRPPEEPLHRSSRNPYVQEERMRDLCMRAKGYEVVASPDPKPQASLDSKPQAPEPPQQQAAR
jgi:hypothetical protein